MSGSGWLRPLVEASRSVRPRITLAVLAGTAAAGATIGLMAASAWLISRAATHPPVLHLMTAIVAVRFFGLSRGVLRYAERLVGHDAALRLLARLRVRYYARLARLAPSGLRHHRRGDLTERVVGDVDMALDALVRVAVPYAIAGGVALGSVALVGALQPTAGVALAVALLLVAVGIPAAQAAATRRADGALAPLQGELTANTVETLQGLADLSAYGALPHRLEQLAGVDARLSAATARSSGTAGIGAALTTVTVGACVLIGLAAGAVAVRAGTLSGEFLAVVALTPLAVFEAVSGLPAAAQRLGATRTALGRVAAVLDAADPTPEPADPVALPDDEHTVTLRDVTAAWVPGRPALRGVTLELRPHRRVALVGASGSGKSTIAALLVRFLDPETGSITIDGRDLRELPTDRVRQVIGLCDEEAYLFDSTIEANLRIGEPNAALEELRDALETVRLLSWVEELPLGLATPVGEHGVQLSGGQRRRIALARALLANPPVLVLDEPTEHLDDEAAKAMTRDLLAATTGRTTLLITHRSFGLEDVDEVVALCEGRVIARDVRR